MKKAAVLLFCLISGSLFAQNDSVSWRQGVLNWQQEMNSEYADSATSPLTNEDRLVFTGLDFYAPDSIFCVVAQLELTPDSRSFPMKTSTTRAPMYRQYGLLHFEIYGKKYSLPAYQRAEVLTTDDYANYLFVPFTDLTNGDETYIGGRYLDFEINSSNVYIIDFNKAYNPYCAYNHKYSCPVPPAENSLDCKIEAGVKKFGH